MPATLSISTVVFPQDELLCDEQLAWLQRLGIDCVELSKDDGPRCHESREILEHVRALAEEAGVRFGSLHAWSLIDGVMDACRTAAALGAGLVVVHARHETLVEDFDSQVEQVSEYVGWCVGHGIIPTIENSSKQPLEPFVALFEAVPGLKLTLDVKHACKPETLGLTHVDYMRELGDRLANLHISGINRERDPVTGDGTPPGDDMISWTDLAADLAERDYHGLITIESHLPNYLDHDERLEAYADLPDVDTPENTVYQRLSSYAVNFYRRELAAAL
jgi:sugar phosphate isomerase/epimerase